MHARRHNSSEDVPNNNVIPLHREVPPKKIDRKAINKQKKQDKLDVQFDKIHLLRADILAKQRIEEANK
jgi:hypothetical protein